MSGGVWGGQQTGVKKKRKGKRISKTTKNEKNKKEKERTERKSTRDKRREKEKRNGKKEMTAGRPKCRKKAIISIYRTILCFNMMIV